MEELIAKRYIKGLNQSIDASDMENISTVFSVLADAFNEPKFNQIINSKQVEAEAKVSLLLDCVKSAESDKVNNFVKLLAENGRINIIPAIASEMKKELARSKKTFSGTVSSNAEIDAATIEGLSQNLGKKVDATITLDFVKTDFDGIKVEVEDLGIEVNFSKSRLNMQLIDHILKAI
jgi:F-type H+-transporting ATPase subunit delta